MSINRKSQIDYIDTQEKIVGGYWLNWIPSAIHIDDIDENYNLIYFFHAQPVGGPPGTTGEIYFDQPDDITELKRLYPGFLITAPPALWNPRDLTFCQSKVQANALNYAASQYYDGPNLAEQSYVIDNIQQWISTLGESHVVVGFGVNSNQTNYMTIDQAVATWNQLQSTYTNIRGVFNWNIDTDEDQGWTFADNMGSFVTQGD